VPANDNPTTADGLPKVYNDGRTMDQVAKEHRIRLIEPQGELRDREFYNHLVGIYAAYDVSAPQIATTGAPGVPQRYDPNDFPSYLPPVDIWTRR